MPKRASSKISSYIKPAHFQSQNQERTQVDDETVIADMAKGFLQAQAEMSKGSQQTNSHEVMDLLSKINNQLENLQNSLNDNSKSGGQFQHLLQQSAQNQQSQQSQGQTSQQPQQAQQQASGSKSEADVSQELRNLFSILLQNDSQQSNSAGASKGSSQQQNQNQGQNQSQGQGQVQGQGQNQSNGQGNKSDKNSTIAVQTAAQVLAQAQYELSNELETSLKKLKQVISESEKIANKISNLLGEENSQK